jgi:hypothetical protein
MSVDCASAVTDGFDVRCFAVNRSIAAIDRCPSSGGARIEPSRADAGRRRS